MFFFRGNIKAIQKYRFKILIKQLYKSKFYKDYAIKKIDFKKFPIIEKSIFMKHFNEINTAKITYEAAMSVALEAETSRDFSPMIDGITVGLSTGTSGNRGLFLADENDRAKWVASILNRVLGLSLSKRKVAFFLRANNNLYQASESRLLKFHFFDIFLDIESHVKRLNVVQPDILVAQPSLLMILANCISNNSLKLTLKKVISVAEVLSIEDRKHLEKVFDQQIHEVYQCTEGFLASTCKNGTLHFNEDFLIIEKKYLNKEKTKFHPIITDLLRYTQPVVRYELNDIITEKSNCLCGSKWLGIETIEGRSDDILIFQSVEKNEVSIFPDFFRRAIVLADESIVDYCVIQTGICELELYIGGSNPQSYLKAEKAINSLLLSHFIENIKIKKLTFNPSILGQKKRRVKNEFRKTN